jgi:hypothetical protein
LVKKAKAVFVFEIKTANGQVVRTLDLKNGAGSFTKGAGKQSGQKLFTSGKLKGNMMLAMKLDGILKDLKPQAKL